MDRSGASCYIYSKASGMLASSYTGERSLLLKVVKSLEELWSMLFKESVPSASDTELAELIEKKSAEKLAKEYRTLLNTYSKPYEVCTELLNAFEQVTFKNNFENEPVKKIFKACDKLSGSDRENVKKILTERYSIKNIIWVMRLKVYYKMSAEEIKDQILYLDDAKSSNDPFVKEALKIADWKIDDYPRWSKWKYSYLVNKHDSKTFRLDPKFAEEKASEEFYKSVRRAFHREPFTPLVLVSWFFVKQSELDLIRTVTESLRLNVELDQVV